MQKRRDVATNRAKARLASLGIAYDLSGVDDAAVPGKASPVRAALAEDHLVQVSPRSRKCLLE